jgi:hypothetical protein
MVGITLPLLLLQHFIPGLSMIYIKNTALVTENAFGNASFLPGPIDKHHNLFPRVSLVFGGGLKCVPCSSSFTAAASTLASSCLILMASSPLSFYWVAVLQQCCERNHHWLVVACPLLEGS